MKFVFAFAFVVILAAVFSQECQAQKQLVVLKREKVLLRLYPGDEVVFRLKGSKSVKRSYINNLNDTSFLAHRDPIAFHKVDRIYHKRSNLLNVIGGLFVTAGVGYFVIDQVNVGIVQGDGFDIEEKVAIPSAILVGAGLPMLLSKKKYTKLGGRYRIIYAEEGSPFYRPDYRRSMDDL